MPALYFLGNQLLGSGKQFWWSDSQPITHSLAFMCPQCGVVWGRVIQSPSNWQPVTSGCQEHPWPRPSDIGGSFILPWRQGCPQELPPEVLRYELELRLKKEQA